MIQRYIPIFVLLPSLYLTLPLFGQEEEDFSESSYELENSHGSFWLGPHIGGVLGISGPRGGYSAGIILSYRTPYYFYYNLELTFLHMLPKTISVKESTQTLWDEESNGTQVVTAVPAHEAKVKGLYGVPLILTIGLRYQIKSIVLRTGVGLGAMFSLQSIESFSHKDSEYIISFCIRPGLGIDILTKSQKGMIGFDISYLWQDAKYQMTGGKGDSSSLVLTLGYSWRM